MIPEEIPQELVDILDERAGRKHSRTGSVLTTLAEILTKYQEMIMNASGEASPQRSTPPKGSG